MKGISKWLRSAAGVISICLAIISILLIVLGFSLNSSNAENIVSILFGLATNLIGIIITVSFVQHVIDRQSIREECNKEREKILRFDKIMQLLFQNYIMYYNSILTPLEQRINNDDSKLKTEFTFADMQDLYLPSLYLRNNSYQPAIVSFYEAELALRNYCMNFIKEIDFKYNPRFLDVFMEFIKVSLELDVRDAILGNQHLKIGDKKYTIFIKECIGDNSKNWVEIVHSNKSTAYAVGPYVTLFDMLQIQGALVLRYLKLIDDLNQNQQ